MTFRPLGRSAVQVSPLCLGGNVFGWTVDEATSFSLLDAWLDAGFNFIDTADVYSTWVPGHAGGESETVIGKWLKRGGRRERVVIATKVGMDMGGGRVGLRPGYIRRAVEDSLRRLQVDCIDLYQSHKDDENTPVEDTLGAYAELVAAGKVRLVGASNFSAPRLAQALAASGRDGLPRYETLQPLYNLYDRADFEDQLQPLCVKERVSVVSYYALAAGFLTGKYRCADDASQSARGKGVVGKYLNARGLQILAALDEVALETGSTPGQVAIAWLLTRAAVASPIASATSLAQLQDLVAATRLQLAPEALGRLDRASAPEGAGPAQAH
jgi:aryl-alcohol dehydrogenase-like predicted oxidoreductase